MAEHHSFVNGWELKITSKGAFIVKDTDGTPVKYTFDYTVAVNYCKYNRVGYEKN